MDNKITFKKLDKENYETLKEWWHSERVKQYFRGYVSIICICIQDLVKVFDSFGIVDPRFHLPLFFYLIKSFPFSHHSVFHTENTENIENTERKTVIKIQKNGGCFLTSSLRKLHTSRLPKQICKNSQTLDTTVKIEAGRSEIARTTN